MTSEEMFELHRLRAENEKLRTALEPFANALKGNWSHQPDSLPIVAGYGAYDLRLGFQLGDFRRARAALQQEGQPEAPVKGWHHQVGFPNPFPNLPSKPKE